jgi:transcription termination/antitermination protein NusA
MTPEQLEEIPGIGEKTLEKISVAVRHYFGQYEEGEERPAISAAASDEADSAAEAAEAASDASLAEEEDALKLDLDQDDGDRAGEEDVEDEGTGLISDDVAEEQIGEITETGSGGEDDGGESVDPGQQDTSHRLRETAVTEDVAESGELREEDDRNSGNGA